MSRLIYSMMVSLDGYIETPARAIDWIRIDEEVHSFANEQARERSAFLYGRRLYELMAGYWPTADEDPSAPACITEFARIWREKPKVVFSRTLESVDWNSRLVRDDAAGAIAALKAQPGADLEIGGAELAATAVRLGLVDEYRLFVNPVILGGGTPFYPPLDEPIDLRLSETHRFDSGVVFLRYEVVKRER